MSGCHEPTFVQYGDLVLKVKDLEQRYHGLLHDQDYLEERINRTYAHIEKLEELIDEQSDYAHLEHSIDRLNNIVVDLIRKNSKEKIPHKCPVCNSPVLNGVLAQVSISIDPNKQIVCPACEGKGIVWG